MLELKKYRVVAYYEENGGERMILTLERNGEVFDVETPGMPHDDLDVLMEGTARLAGKIENGRIVEYWII